MHRRRKPPKWRFGKPLLSASMIVTIGLALIAVSWGPVATRTWRQLSLSTMDQCLIVGAAGVGALAIGLFMVGLVANARRCRQRTRLCRKETPREAAERVAAAARVKQRRVANAYQEPTAAEMAEAAEKHAAAARELAEATKNAKAAVKAGAPAPKSEEDWDPEELQGWTGGQPWAVRRTGEFRVIGAQEPTSASRPKVPALMG